MDLCPGPPAGADGAGSVKISAERWRVSCQTLRPRSSSHDFSRPQNARGLFLEAVERRLPSYDTRIVLPNRRLCLSGTRIVFPNRSLLRGDTRIVLPNRSLPHHDTRIVLPLRTLPPYDTGTLLPPGSLPRDDARIGLPVRTLLSLDTRMVIPNWSLLCGDARIVLPNRSTVFPGNAPGGASGSLHESRQLRICRCGSRAHVVALWMPPLPMLLRRCPLWFWRRKPPPARRWMRDAVAVMGASCRWLTAAPGGRRRRCPGR